MSNVLLLNTSVSKAEEKSKNFKKLKSRPKKRNKLNISSIPFFPKKTYKKNSNPEKIEKIKPEQNPPNNPEPIITNNNGYKINFEKNKKLYNKFKQKFLIYKPKLLSQLNSPFYTPVPPISLKKKGLKNVSLKNSLLSPSKTFI